VVNTPVNDDREGVVAIDLKEKEKETEEINNDIVVDDAEWEPDDISDSDSECDEEGFLPQPQSVEGYVWKDFVLHDAHNDLRLCFTPDSLIDRSPSSLLNHTHHIFWFFSLEKKGDDFVGYCRWNDCASSRKNSSDRGNVWKTSQKLFRHVVHTHPHWYRDEISPRLPVSFAMPSQKTLINKKNTQKKILVEFPPVTISFNFMSALLSSDAALLFPQTPSMTPYHEFNKVIENDKSSAKRKKDSSEVIELSPTNSPSSLKRPRLTAPRRSSSHAPQQHSMKPNTTMSLGFSPPSAASSLVTLKRNTDDALQWPTIIQLCLKSVFPDSSVPNNRSFCYELVPNDNCGLPEEFVNCYFSSSPQSPLFLFQVFFVFLKSPLTPPAPPAPFCLSLFSLCVACFCLSSPASCQPFSSLPFLFPSSLYACVL
jgi:hypothetical protein